MSRLEYVVKHLQQHHKVLKPGLGQLKGAEANLFTDSKPNQLSKGPLSSICNMPEG